MLFPYLFNVYICSLRHEPLSSFVCNGIKIDNKKKKVYASFLMVGSPKSLSRKSGGKFKSLVMYDYTRITNDQVDVPYGLLLLLVCVILTI
jgi:hypothetical protein